MAGRSALVVVLIAVALAGAQAAKRGPKITSKVGRGDAMHSTTVHGVPAAVFIPRRLRPNARPPPHPLAPHDRCSLMWRSMGSLPGGS